MKITTHTGKGLIKPSEFGKRKDVSTTAVWQAIHAERIPVTLIGEKEDVYINWNTAQHIQFDENKKRNYKK